jgi:uncharacterized protein YbaR (Trm112 family)
MDPKILKLLKCPHSGENLLLMSEDSLEKINDQIRSGKVKNLNEVTIEQELRQALCNKSETYFYPVMDGIPLLDKTKAIIISKQR